MSFLITGGYGFIGAWIARKLLAAGHDVTIYDLRQDHRRLRLVMSEEECAKCRFVAGNVTDLAALSGAINRHAITHVIHLAGLQVPTCKADSILGGTVNVLGTLAVFEAVRASQGRVQRVVYASSAAVFGPPGGEGSQPDDARLVPSTHYGVFKVCNEGNARIYHQDHGISSIGLRPWTVYGPGRDLGMTSDPTKAIKAAFLGRKFHINFGGYTDFQYVADVADAFIESSVRPYGGAGAFNLRGEVVTIQQFHEVLCEVLPAARELITFGTQQIAIAYDLSDAGITAAIGELPKTSLAAGIRETVEVFARLQNEGRLDASELDLPTPKAMPKVDEV